MDRYRVYYNAHVYSDNSDTPKSRSRIVKADSAEEAMNAMYAKRTAQWDSLCPTVPGKAQYIGMIHSAEKIS